MGNKKRTNKASWIVSLGYNCLFALIIMTIISINWFWIAQTNRWIQVIAVCVLSIGSTMIYLLMATKLEEIRRKYGKH